MKFYITLVGKDHYVEEFETLKEACKRFAELEKEGVLYKVEQLVEIDLNTLKEVIGGLNENLSNRI